MPRLLSLLHRPRRRESGLTTVEFALVLPLFLIVALGTLEGGRFVVAHLMLSYAVNQGARAATLSGATAATVEAAVTGSAPMLGLTASQVEITGTVPATVGSTVTVSIGVVNPANKYTFQSVIPSSFSPFSTRSWSAQASMVAR